MSVNPGREAENGKRFFSAQQVVIKHANEANNNWLTCTRCREFAQPCAHELWCGMFKALGLPCVWVECKFGDKCYNQKCIYMHSWQKAEFKAAGLPWALIHFYNEDSLPYLAFEMPLMGSALEFNKTTNRNGWRNTKPSHIDQMYDFSEEFYLLLSSIYQSVQATSVMTCKTHSVETRLWSFPSRAHAFWWVSRNPVSSSHIYITGTPVYKPACCVTLAL
jgi:hypothetical protein